MASFTEKHTDFMSDEINDVLLEKRAKMSAQQAPHDEEIYELAAEDEISDAAHQSDSLSEQVDQLCREYAAINLQLQNSLAVSTKLNKQLENAKKRSASSHLALFIAALALIGVAAIAGIGWQMQDKLAQVDMLLATLQKQSADASHVNARLDAVDEKVSRIFAAENVDGVLQVTRALKAQVDKLADSNNSVLATTQPASDDHAAHTVDATEGFSINRAHGSAKPTDKTKLALTERHRASMLVKKSKLEDSPKTEAAKAAVVDKSQAKDKAANKEVAVKLPSLDNATPPQASVVADNAKTSPPPLVFPSLTSASAESVKSASPDNAKEGDDKKSAVAKKEDNADKSPLKSNWLISLGSFKSKSMAKQRAEGFKKAGVNVQLIEVQAKNQTWYRVVTKTTKTKQDAENYAEQVKKNLKLGAVSMTKN